MNVLLEKFQSCNCRGHFYVGLLAFLLYLPAFWWGAPHATAADRVSAWGVDDAMPLVPLAEVHNVFYPKPDRNLGYPLLHPFLVSVFYAPYLGFLWLTGQFAHPSGAFPYGFANPAQSLFILTLIARMVSVLLGAGVAIAAYDAALALWDRRTALLAALFAMLSFPMFYYSRTGNPDVPVLFFTAAALAAFARILAGGFTVRRSVALGAFVGCALATKEPSLASFIAIPFVLLWIQWRDVIRGSGKGIASWEFWRAPVVCAAASFVAFGIGSGLFVDPQRFFAHVEFARTRIHALSSGDIAFFRSFPNTMQGNWELFSTQFSLLVDCMTWPGVFLSVAGIILIFVKERKAALFLLPAITYWGVLFTSARVAQLRYLMPVAVTLGFYAAYAVSRSRDSRNVVLRYATALAAVFTLGVCLLRGADLTYAMLHDSRYDAAAWFAEHAHAGDRVEYFGSNQKLPPLEREITTARPIEYRGAIFKPRADAAVVAEIGEGWQQRRPQFILIMPDHSSTPGLPYPATCPPQIYAWLLDGSLGYRLATQFESPRLFPWVGRSDLDYPTVNPPIRIFVPAKPVEGSR